MAHIMEFLLNLLLLRGKLLTSTAAETFHEAIKKCLQFRRKIAVEYSTTQIVLPFENMLEFVNYNSSQYTCDGENFVITTTEEYDMYEKLRSEGKQFQDLEVIVTCMSNGENPQATPKKPEEETEKEPVKPKKQNTENEEYILENLHAILKSQEFLLKNMMKLVKLLESNEVINSSNQKLDSVKKKLVACTDILSNTCQTQKFSNIINNIIEEEITRCRFRHGESKTSAEISLKAHRPEGLEAALDASCKKQQDRNTNKQHTKTPKKLDEPKPKKQEDAIKPESPKISVKKDQTREHKSEADLKKNVQQYRAKSKSDSLIHSARPEGQPKTSTSVDLENSKKLLEVNQNHFKKFEDELWHSLTSMKFMSLRDDFLNSCKCAFYNKRQFIATETAITKKMKEAECNDFLDINNKMFQMMERKLMFEAVQRELTRTGQLPLTDQEKISLSEKGKEEQHVSKEKEKEKHDARKDHKLESNPFLLLQEPRQKMQEVQIDVTPRKLQTNVQPLKESVKENETIDKKENPGGKTSKIVKAKSIVEANSVEMSAFKVSEYRKSKSHSADSQARKIRNDQETNTIINSFKLTKSMYTDLKIQIDAPQAKKQDQINVKSTEVKATALKKDYVAPQVHVSGSKIATTIVKSSPDLTHSKEQLQKAKSTPNIPKKSLIHKMSEGDIPRSDLKEETSEHKLPATLMSHQEHKLQFSEATSKVQSPTNVTVQQNESTHKLITPQILPEITSSKDVEATDSVKSQDADDLSSDKSPATVENVQNPQSLSKTSSFQENFSKLPIASLPDTQKIEILHRVAESVKNVDKKESGEGKPIVGALTVDEENKFKMKKSSEGIRDETIVKPKSSTENLPLLVDLKDIDKKTSEFPRKFEEKSTEKLETKKKLSSMDLPMKEKLSDIMTKPSNSQQKLIPNEIFENKLERNTMDSKTVIMPKLILPQSKGLEQLENKMTEASPRPQKEKLIAIPGLRTLSEHKTTSSPPKNKTFGNYFPSYGERMKKTSPRIQQKDQKQEQKSPKIKSSEMKEDNSPRMKLQHPKQRNISPQAVSASVAAVILQKNPAKQKSQKPPSLVPYTPGKMPPNWKGVIEKVSSASNLKHIIDVPKKINVSPQKTSPRSVSSTGDKTTIKEKVFDEKSVEKEILEKYSRTSWPTIIKLETPEKVEEKIKAVEKSPAVFPAIKEDILAAIKEDIALKVKEEKQNKSKKKEKAASRPPKSTEEKNSNPKVTATETEKTVSDESRKENKSVSDEESEKAKKEKIFKELEETIRTVNIFVKKKSVKPPKGVKTTTEKAKRKIDEPVKKSMSTKQLVKVLKQQSAASILKKKSKSILRKRSTHSRAEQEYSTYGQISNDIILGRHSSFKEVKKQATKYSLPCEKTFLKKSCNYQPKNRSASSQEKLKSKQSPITVETNESNKPNSQMRRTTKNAMKRQQAVTTPKFSSSEEKKRSQVCLAEEAKTGKSGQKRQKVEKIALVADAVPKQETNLGNIPKSVSPRSAHGKPLLNRSLNKAPCGKNHYVRWKTEEEVETVGAVKS